jgi:excisionase family DNA binding protein
MGAEGSLPAFLTVDEVAGVLRCQPEKVYRLAARGELPSYKIEGRRLIERSEFFRWLEGQRQGVTCDVFGTTVKQRRRQP